MLKEDLERWIFYDYQYETKPIGRVKLLKFIKEGLPFILDDMPKERQIIYGIQYWQCEVLSTGGYYPKGYIKIFPIKYITNVGPMTSNKDEEFFDNEITEEEYLQTQRIIDKFIEIDGTEAF